MDSFSEQVETLQLVVRLLKTTGESMVVSIKNSF